MTQYTYIPLAAFGVRLLAPVEAAKPFLSEHREALVEEFGFDLMQDLEASLDGNLDAARRFAAALVPGSIINLHADDEIGYIRANYRDSAGAISGTCSAPRRNDPARLVACAAINLWYSLNHDPRNRDNG